MFFLADLIAFKRDCCEAVGASVPGVADGCGKAFGLLSGTTTGESVFSSSEEGGNSIG